VKSKLIITESQFKNILEQEKEFYEPITIDSIKDVIIQNINEYVDVTSIRSRRRINQLVDNYSKKIYYNFMDKLNYISDEGEFQDIVGEIRGTWI
jgi:hypothetical protein